MEKIKWRHSDIEVYDSGSSYILHVDKSGIYRIESDKEILLPEGKTEINKNIDGCPVILTKKYLNDLILSTRKSDKEAKIILPENLVVNSEPEINPRHVCPCEDPVEVHYDDSSILVENMCIGQEYSLEVDFINTENSVEDSTEIKQITPSSKLDLSGLTRKITVKNLEGISGKIFVKESIDISRNYIKKFEVKSEESYTDIILPLPDQIKIDETCENPSIEPNIKFKPDVGDSDATASLENVSSNFVNLTDISNTLSLLFNKPSWMCVERFQLEDERKEIIDSDSVPSKVEDIKSYRVNCSILTSDKILPNNKPLSKNKSIDTVSRELYYFNLGNPVEYFNIEVFLKKPEKKKVRLVLEYPKKDLIKRYMITENISRIEVEKDEVKIRLKNEETDSVLEKIHLSTEEVLYTRSLYIDLEE